MIDLRTELLVTTISSYAVFVAEAASKPGKKMECSVSERPFTEEPSAR